MTTRHLFWLFLLLSPAALAQTNVPGEAPVTLKIKPGDCGLPTRTVDVFIDVDGLEGIGGEAGINGFVLVFNLDRGETFQNAVAGIDPPLDWTFAVTDPVTVAMTKSFTLVGAVADPMAPNQNYHVASVVLDGPELAVTLSFNHTASSLSSRVANGDGPGPMLLSSPDPIRVNLVSLSLGQGLSQWRQMASDYDLEPPFGSIDVVDLAALVNCTTGGR